MAVNISGGGWGGRVSETPDLLVLEVQGNPHYMSRRPPRRQAENAGRLFSQGPKCPAHNVDSGAKVCKESNLLKTSQEPERQPTPRSFYGAHSFCRDCFQWQE